MINKLQFDELEQTFEMSFTEEIPIKEDWDNGYIEGYKDGEEVGFNDGYTTGETDGYIVGIEVGKKEGYKDGYNSGHTEGWNEGYEKGNEDGYGDGYDIGKEEGIIVGKQEGYEQGKTDENKTLWDNLTNKNTKTFWEYGFYQSGFEYIRPPYKISVGSDSRTICMFSKCPNLIKIEKEYFDLSGALINPTYGNHAVFRTCSKLEVIEDVGLQPSNYYQTYAYNERLHTIELIRAEKTNTFNSTFSLDKSLRKVTFSEDSVIGKSISFQHCPLSKASITNVIEHLCTDTDITGQTLTLKKSAVNEAFGIDVDDETTYPVGSEYYELRYSKRNWNIAYA